ncbi:MAG: HAD family hydrolase [Deinococcales bacterium]
MTRDEAYALVCQFTQSESLRKHMLAVEAAMVHYAGILGGDTEEFAITGLLHDFDYESHPDLGEDGHPFWGVRYLREHARLPEHVLEAILGHYTGSGVARVSKLAIALFAVDELCGFCTAAVYVRPDKSIHHLEVASVKKKLKDKAFAKGVNRADIALGLEELQGILPELTLETHIENVITGLRARAEALGLAGI